MVAKPGGLSWLSQSHWASDRERLLRLSRACPPHQAFQLSGLRLSRIRLPRDPPNLESWHANWPIACKKPLSRQSGYPF